MCDRCAKLGAEIEQLRRDAERAGPEMLPAIEADDRGERD